MEITQNFPNVKDNNKKIHYFFVTTSSGWSKLVYIELVEFNSPVTLSQLYTSLDKVAKKIGQVYMRDGLTNNDATLVQLAQNYYKMAKETKNFSRLVKRQLQEYDKEILNSSAILMDIWCDFDCVVECLLFLVPPDIASMCIYSCFVCAGFPAPFNPACWICIGCITTYAIACAYYCCGW